MTESKRVTGRKVRAPRLVAIATSASDGVAVSARAPQARAVAARETILQAAIKVFAKGGYDGARIETISIAAHTHDRMIYYYFGSKEQLFVEVLETVYQRMNTAEAALQIDLAHPVDALIQIVRFHWNYYLNHPDLISLLNSENMHRGKHFKKASALSNIYPPAVSMLEMVLAAGAAAGTFRAGISSRDLYITIVSLGYFYQSNRYTLSVFLNEDVMDEKQIVQWESTIVDNVLRMVAASPDVFDKLR